MFIKIGIIGGGPAGLTAAIEGARLGIDVTLWEKSRIGERINCAEGFFDPLELLSPPDIGVRYKVKNLIIQIDNEHVIDVSDLNLFMLDRQKWQKGLAERARSTGVLILEEHPISLEKLDSIKRDFDFILDGSGVPSLTSRYYNFKDVYLKEALITAQCRVKSDFSSLDRSFKAAMLKDNSGYGWIFPRNKGEANVGLGIYNMESNEKIKGSELYRKLDQFLISQEINGNIVDRAAGICPNKRPDNLIFDNLLLIGDTAGLTSPFHGGGIDLACVSALTAVNAIKEGNIEKYPEQLQKKIKRKMDIELFLKRMWMEKDRSRLEAMTGLIGGRLFKNGVSSLLENFLKVF